MGALWDTGKVIKIIGCLQQKDHRSSSLATFKAEASVGGTDKVVAVKTVAERRLANEIAAAWLAEKLGLTYVPRSMLLTDGSGQLASNGGGTTNKLWFATESCNLPCFSFTDYNDLVNVANTREFSAICVFDHDMAFGGEWRPSTLESTADKLSQQGMLATNLMHATQETRGKMMDFAKEWSLVQINSSVTQLDELGTIGIIPQADVDALKCFIVTRLTKLNTLVEMMLKSVVDNHGR